MFILFEAWLWMYRLSSQPIWSRSPWSEWCKHVNSAVVYEPLASCLWHRECSPPLSDLAFVFILRSAISSWMSETICYFWWSLSGTHGPPCDRAGPPARGPERRAGPACVRPGKGEQPGVHKCNKCEQVAAVWAWINNNNNKSCSDVQRRRNNLTLSASCH